MSRSVSSDAGSRFIARLMLPVLDADLLDPELKRLEDRARRAAKRKASDAWERGMCHVRLAMAQQDVETWTWAAAGRPGRCPRTSDPAIHKAVRNQMKIPAPDLTALKWKRRFQKFGGLSNEFAPLIAADQARLEGGKA